MNKKSYIEPNIKVVKITTMHVFASSDPKLGNTYTGGNVFGSEYSGSSDDDSEDW